MDANSVSGSLRRRTTVLALALATGLATMIGLLPAAPAHAGTLAKTGAMWISAQRVEGRTTTFVATWPKVARARYYEVDFLASPTQKALGGSTVQRSRRTHTIKVRATGAAMQTGVVKGLAPGTVYCLQVRARAGRVAGRHSPVFCKQTTRANRGRIAGTVPLAVGTFNVCSAACSTMASWASRRPEVLRRIREMNVGLRGRPIDVLAVQEGRNAVDRGGFLDTSLAGTFTKACVTSKSLQAVYVRDSTYSVVRGGAGSMTFDAYGDGAHGACWARVRENTTGTEVVVVSLHLDVIPSHETVRARETSAVLVRAAADNPGTRVVLAGDFNSHRGHSYDGPRAVLAAKGYDDGYDQSLVYRSVPLRNSGCGPDGSVKLSYTWGLHIDRVFAPAGVAVTSWEVDYRMRSAARYASPMASDHNPVVVELRLPVTPV